MFDFFVTFDHFGGFNTPKYAVSEMIGTTKGRLAIRMFKEIPVFREKYWGKRFWTKEYFVGTINVDARIIRQYFRKQEIEERQAKQLTVVW